MWRQKIKVKNLFTEEEDYKSVQDSMNAVADVLAVYGFPMRIINYCRAIPEENSLLYANSVIDSMYNYADRERIWVD